MPATTRKGPRAIKTVDNFAAEDLGEHKVLRIALDCGAIVKNVYKVLEPALKRRTAAAHPNNVVLTPLQAGRLRRRFDVVTKSLDRFSRDEDDTHASFKRPIFAGVSIVTLRATSGS